MGPGEAEGRDGKKVRLRTTSLESRVWFSSYIVGSGFSAQAANVFLPDGAQFRFTVGQSW